VNGGRDVNGDMRGVVGGNGDAGVVPARPRSWRRGDLRGRPFPDLSAVTAGATTGPDGGRREALARLRQWAEQEAEDTIDWYLADKRLKRTGSRLLQGLAIAFAVAGTAVPLGTAAAGGSGQGWGYVLLAVAAGCKGFDHFFGLSATWMRDIAVAQSLRGELNAVRLEWASDLLRAGSAGGAGDAADAAGHPATPVGPGEPLTPAEVERRLALINRLVTAVRSQVEAETADWQAEFSSSTSQLHGQGGALPGGGDRLPGV
jgi:hypothetical protein